MEILQIIWGIRWNPSSAMSWFSAEEYLKHVNFERPGIEVFPKHIQHDKEKINKLNKLEKLENQQTS